MAIVAGDWTVTRSTGNIRYTGDAHTGTAPTYATVIELHRWLQSLADDEISTIASLDELDITDLNPSARSTDNIITLLGIWNLDQASSEHIYNGSIIQGSDANDDEFVWDGIVNFGNPEAQIQLIQDAAVISDDWWNKSIGGTATAGSSGLVLEDSGASWTVDEWIGYTIYNVTDGSQGICTDSTATTITVGSLEGGTNAFANTNNYAIGVGVNQNLASGISHRFMVPVRQNSVDIDGRKLLGTTRRLSKNYAEFPIGAGTTRGNNVLALSDADDLNNETAVATIAGWTGITPTHGFVGIDVDNDTVNENYSDSWDANTPTRAINDFYERLKWLSRDGSSSTVHAISGELYRGITHQVAYTGLTGGTFTEDALVAWGTNIQFDTKLTNFTVGEYFRFTTGGAVGKLIALDDDAGAGNALFIMETTQPGYTAPVNDELIVRADGTASDGATVDTTITDGSALGGYGLVVADNNTDTMWIQVLAGNSPNGVLPLWGATLAGVYDNDAGVNAATSTVTARTVSTPFVGASTGSSIIGAYGLGVQTNDLSQNDKLFDLTGAQRVPPNNVTFEVGGLVVGESQLLVGPYDGSTLDINGDPEIDYNQITLNGTLSTDVTSITVNAHGMTDIPASGVIRVQDDNGVWRRILYGSWTGTTFDSLTDDTGQTGQKNFTTTNATTGNSVFIAYLDLEATTTEHSFTFVYNAPRQFVIKERDGKAASPTKEFLGTGTMSSTGGSITVIRTTDL